MRDAEIEAKAVVIGGGLAGMSAAWELSRTGRWHVHLYEKAERLGGKAGSEFSRNSQYYSDHGYHLFPAWYDNVRQLMGEAGIDYDVELIPGERFISKVKTRNEMTGLPEGFFLDRWLETLVFVWAIGELVEGSDDELVNLSLAAFLDKVYRKQYGSTRLYEWAKERHGSLTLKALSNPPDNISALTCARMWRRWMSPWTNIGKPSWSALRGSLQQRFIDPLEIALEEQGVKIHKGLTVSDIRLHQNAPETMMVQYGDRAPEARDLRDKTLVLAVPAEALRDLFDPDHLPVWADNITKDTDKGQMAAIDCIVNPLLTDTPTDHFGFGPGDLTGFDITRHWIRSELPPKAVEGKAAVRTVLQVIATNFEGPMAGHPNQVLIDTVTNQVAGVFATNTVSPAETHLNDDAMLYLNTVANSQTRPYYDTPSDNGLDRVFLAGDYCKTSIDVASMEAAVASGRLAAERADGGLPEEDYDSPAWVAWVMGFGKFSGLFGFLAWLSRLRGIFART